MMELEIIVSMLSDTPKMFERYYIILIYCEDMAQVFVLGAVSRSSYINLQNAPVTFST